MRVRVSSCEFVTVRVLVGPPSLRFYLKSNYVEFKQSKNIILMIISNRLKGKNFLSFPHHQGKNENSCPVGQEFLYHQGKNRNSRPGGQSFVKSKLPLVCLLLIHKNRILDQWLGLE